MRQTDTDGRTDRRSQRCSSTLWADSITTHWPISDWQQPIQRHDFSVSPCVSRSQISLTARYQLPTSSACGARLPAPPQAPRKQQQLIKKDTTTTLLWHRQLPSATRITGVGRGSSSDRPRYHAPQYTHPFNGPFSGTTRVSRYQKRKTNMDFTEARDALPAAQPTASKHWRHTQKINTNLGHAVFSSKQDFSLLWI